MRLEFNQTRFHENGAKECIVRSRRELSNEYLVFTCKIWIRYSRERAWFQADLIFKNVLPSRDFILPCVSHPPIARGCGGLASRQPRFLGCGLADRADFWSHTFDSIQLNIFWIFLTSACRAFTWRIFFAAARFSMDLLRSFCASPATAENLKSKKNVNQLVSSE